MRLLENTRTPLSKVCVWIVEWPFVQSLCLAGRMHVLKVYVWLVECICSKFVFGSSNAFVQSLCLAGRMHLFKVCVFGWLNACVQRLWLVV